MSYSILPPSLLAQIGGFVSDDLPSYRNFLLSSKSAGEAMSEYATTSTVRARTIHVFKQALKKEHGHIASAMQLSHLSQTLYVLLGPCQTQKELGETQTKEQAAQECDLYEFMSITGRHILLNFLAHYDYLEYHVLVRHLVSGVFPTETNIKRALDEKYKTMHLSRCTCRPSPDRPCSNAILN
eukprot:5187548-Pleurochrysis_carterae.AAC.1